jgi:hypothetical protein
MHTGRAKEVTKGGQTQSLHTHTREAASPYTISITGCVRAERRPRQANDPPSYGSQSRPSTPSWGTQCAPCPPSPFAGFQSTSYGHTPRGRSGSTVERGNGGGEGVGGGSGGGRGHTNKTRVTRRQRVTREAQQPRGGPTGGRGEAGWHTDPTQGQAGTTQKPHKHRTSYETQHTSSSWLVSTTRRPPSRMLLAD